MTRSPGKLIAVSALFTALGLILGYIETFIVLPIRVPGIRIGLSNIITVITLFLFGPYVTAAVLFSRVILSALLFGSGMSFIYGICGAVTAFGVMIIFKRFGFSVCGVSVAGAVMHNIAQIVVAFFFVGNGYVFTYIFALVPAGICAGLIVGALANLIIARLKRIDTGLGKEQT